jgi:DNA-binding CsgD family transcriptional regulator
VTPSVESTTLTAPPRAAAPYSRAGTGHPTTGILTEHAMPTQWTYPRVSAAALRSTSILVAEPNHVSLATLAASLRAVGIGRLTQAESVAEVDEVIQHHSPGHLALVSLAFEDEAFRLIPALARAGWLRVNALAPRAEIEPIRRAILAGAGGVLRGNPTGAVIELPARIHDLSPREIEVLSLVADGRANKWIAEELQLSALTVKSHLARISRKLGTGDRSHLVAIAMRGGIID